MRKVVIDFETASNCNLKEAGAWRYSEDVTTEVICLAYCEIRKPYILAAVTWLPGGDDELNARFRQYVEDPETVFVAHNSGFEKAVWRNIMVKIWGWPDIPNDRWEDTAAVCAMKALPISLDKAVLALRLTNHKDKEGSKITKSLSKANKKGAYNRSPEILERVYAYNRQDVFATEELLGRVGTLTPDERPVWLLDQKINERGIALDMPFVDACQKIVDQASEPLLREFNQITGGLKPSQTAKFKAWVNDKGVKLDSLNKEVVAQLLGEEDEDDDTDGTDNILPLPVLPADVHRALSLRSVVGSASVKKLRRMQSCVGFDGRARGLLQYHGASPGRWAGRLLQPHNFPRGTIKDSTGEKPGCDVTVPAIMSGDAALVSCTIGEPIETVVSCLRHAIISAPKHVLLSGDFVGIEARVVLALAGQHDKTAMLAAGLSPYIDMARMIFKRPIDKKKDPFEYQMGKFSVLGLGFQMGVPKFKAKYAKDESDEFCQKIVDTYRKEWAPCVPKVWRGLEQAALDTVYKLKPHSAYGVEYRLEDGWLTARLPSERKLWYYNPRQTRKAMPWDENDIRLAWTYQVMKAGRLKTVDAYGGLLTENVVQGLARDIMVNRMFKLESNNFPIVLTVHDEIVSEPLVINANEKFFAEIMEDRTHWERELMIPIAVETWKSDRYRK